MGKKLGIKSRTNKPFGLDNLLSGADNTVAEKQNEKENQFSDNNEIIESALNKIHNEVDEIVEKVVEDSNDSEEIEDTSEKKKVGRPKTSSKIAKRSAEIGTMEGELRYTAIINEDLLNEVKKIAYWERLKMKDMFNYALESFINNYIENHGEIKDIPSKKRIQVILVGFLSNGDRKSTRLYSSYEIPSRMTSPA